MTKPKFFIHELVTITPNMGIVYIIEDFHRSCRTWRYKIVQHDYISNKASFNQIFLNDWNTIRYMNEEDMKLYITAPEDIFKELLK